MGFTDAKHLGGKDESDIIIKSAEVMIDTKTTKEGVINEGYVNFPAMRRYREKYGAKYIDIGIVASGFAQGNIINTTEKEEVVLKLYVSYFKIMLNFHILRRKSLISYSNQVKR